MLELWNSPHLYSRLGELVGRSWNITRYWSSDVLGDGMNADVATLHVDLGFKSSRMVFIRSFAVE